MRFLLASLTLLALVTAAPAGEIGVPDNIPTSGVASNAIPFRTSFMGGEGRYQALVPASMMGGKAFRINELSFAPTSIYTPTPLVAPTFVVTFAHLGSLPLSATFANNLTKDGTVVFNGPGNYVGTANTWSPVGLTQTFLYNGVDNLVVEVKYLGGTGGFDCYRCGTIERAYTTGAGAFASATATSSGGLAALKMQFKYDDIQLTLSGSPKPGGKVTLDLFAAADAGLPYQLGSSLGLGPIVLGSRQIDLSLDDLLVLSVGNLLPAVFVNYSGVLDASGKAQAAIQIPNLPVLVGVRMHTAFVTVDPLAPFGIKSISGAETLTILP
ncbi:MAG: hypothetical protein JXQ29_12115 [Planctomycetes bacterium]|nr:hypothetical protein [Planctomycetota bacterium]